MIRDAINTSYNEQKAIMKKRRSSPDREVQKKIGSTLPASVRREIKLPFIHMQKLKKDKSSLGKYLLTSREEAGVDKRNMELLRLLNSRS